MRNFHRFLLAALLIAPIVGMSIARAGSEGEKAGGGSRSNRPWAEILRHLPRPERNVPPVSPEGPPRPERPLPAGTTDKPAETGWLRVQKRLAGLIAIVLRS